MEDIAASLQSLAQKTVPVVESKLKDQQDFAEYLCEYFQFEQSLILSSSKPDLYKRICDILAGLMDGFIVLLQARAADKASFKLAPEAVKALQNNPLLFSVNAKHGLELLLRRHDDSFLPAAEAIQQSSLELKQHQVALLASISAGLTAALAELAPDKVQEHLIKLNKNSKFNWLQQINCWQQYSKDHQALQASNKLMQTFMAAYVKHYAKN